MDSKYIIGKQIFTAAEALEIYTELEKEFGPPNGPAAPVVPLPVVPLPVFAPFVSPTIGTGYPLFAIPPVTCAGAAPYNWTASDPYNWAGGRN